MVDTGHELLVQGAALDGTPQPRPALLQMNIEDFPARFFHDLGAPGATPLSTATPVTGGLLYQPVQRVAHVALLQLACAAVGSPRLDPRKVLSAGLVIRRIQRVKGVDQLHTPPAAWMTGADGKSLWVPLSSSQEKDDPDPALRPKAGSGQTELDNLLAAQNAASARSESFSPAFVAPPAICEAIGKTLVFGLIPTASAESSDRPLSAPQYDSSTLAQSFTTLLRAGAHHAPSAGKVVDRRYMSPEFVSNKDNNVDSDFATFSTTLRILQNELGAFDGTDAANSILKLLNKHRVTFGTGSRKTYKFMGTFYKSAADALLSPDPTKAGSITMPDAWDSFSTADADALVKAAGQALQTRRLKVLAPKGRFEDATRLYRLRVFLRVKGDTPTCPPKTVWSEYSDLFRIAAWFEGAGRTVPPVQLPDPTDKNFLQSATPNCSFVMPDSLMQAQSASLPKLLLGSGPGGGTLGLNWICGFNIPIITICAFIVLNIFLTLLNIVFWWLPFIKICIPFPVPVPGTSSGDEP